MFKSLRKITFALITFISFFPGNIKAQTGYHASNDIDTINEDTYHTLNVTDNDINYTGIFDIYLEIVDSPSYGIVEIVSSDSIKYTPYANYNDTITPDIFRYRACVDIIDSCGEANVYMYVIPVDDSPGANNDYDTTFMNTDTTFTVLDNDNDLDEVGLKIKSIVVPPTRGDAQISFPDSISISYQPEANSIYDDSLTYKVCNVGSNTLCNNAKLYINVKSTNFNAPIAVNDTVEVTIDVNNTIDVLANDFDADGDNLIINNITVAPNKGTATIIDGTTINYLPDQAGYDNFTYEVCDDNIPSKCATARVIITITSIPVGPEVYVPNSFSPNNDGINDELEITNLAQFSNFDFKIYNRWGYLIYENTDININWDGKSNIESLSSAGDVPDGTYYYLLTLTGADKPLKGFIVVKR